VWSQSPYRYRDRGIRGIHYCVGRTAITHVFPRWYSRGAPYLFSRPRIIIIQKRPTEQLYRVRKTARLIQFPLGPCQTLSGARLPPRQQKRSPRGRRAIAKVSTRNGDVKCSKAKLMNNCSRRRPSPGFIILLSSPSESRATWRVNRPRGPKILANVSSDPWNDNDIVVRFNYCAGNKIL